MINILNIIDTGGPGGAETVFLAMSTALDPKKFKVISVVSRAGWLTQSLESSGLDPFVVPSSGSFNFRYLSKLRRLARSVQADVVVGHLYGSSIYGAIAALSLGKPAISVLHGQSDVAGHGRMDSLKRAVLRRLADRVVFVSGRLKDQIGGSLGIPESRCTVIPNGVDLTRFFPRIDSPLRRELHVPSETILVGAIGNIRAPKAYDVFLKAARLILERNIRVRFVVAGEGSGKLQSDLEVLRDHLGLTEVVTFLGLRDDVADILASLDVYVLSSASEGFSIACIEALAAGVPVVATRCGGPEDILEHGVTGLLVPTADPQALAAAIERVIKDRELARSLASAGTRVAREKYSLEVMLKAYERLFEEVAASA